MSIGKRIAELEEQIGTLMTELEHAGDDTKKAQLLERQIQKLEAEISRLDYTETPAPSARAMLER